jgi:16S rRNA processing protein RimM
MNRPASGETFRYRNRRVFIPDGYLIVGQVASVHGLRGEVVVELHTDFPERFQAGIVLLTGPELTPLHVLQARPHKSNMLVRFQDVNSRDEAEELRGAWLYIEEGDAVDLEEGDYWIHDIIGLQVVSTTGVHLGQITDVMSTGANDVYIVQPAPGVNRDRELLLPAIADVVQEVDLENGRITVTLLPGLLDED